MAASFTRLRLTRPLLQRLARWLMWLAACGLPVQALAVAQACVHQNTVPAMLAKPAIEAHYGADQTSRHSTHQGKNHCRQLSSSAHDHPTSEAQTLTTAAHCHATHATTDSGTDAAQGNDSCPACAHCHISSSVPVNLNVAAVITPAQMRILPVWSAQTSITPDQPERPPRRS